MSRKNEQGSIDVKTKNVLGKPLHQHSSPSTAPSNLPSSINAGSCTSTNPIAAVLTNAFLDMTASNGTDLRKAGVGPGQSFCIDASTWKSAADKGGDDVPRVKLESTHQGALDKVDLGLLKKWAQQDNDHAHGAARPGDGKGLVKESQQIGGKEPRA